MIDYLEQPVQLLDGYYIVQGNNENGGFVVEFTKADEAWEYYIKNKP